jgi:osmoprotectant transport system ATP-binding protein
MASGGVEFEQVSVRLDATDVLSDVSLSLEAGKTHVLLGPSGCGKSTMLRLALGLVTATRGVVRLLGDDVVTLPRAQLAARVGSVVQSGGLFPHLSAAANVELAGRAVGRALSSSVEALFRQAGLEPALQARLPSELSGGQRQRVALARALALDAPVLLLDEPLGAVDPLLRSELQDELRALFRRTARTVLFVTHDLAEAAFFGDTLTILNAGRIEQHGAPEAVISTPATPFVTRFLASQRSLHRVGP